MDEIKCHCCGKRWAAVRIVFLSLRYDCFCALKDDITDHKTVAPCQLKADWGATKTMHFCDLRLVLEPTNVAPALAVLESLKKGVSNSNTAAAPFQDSEKETLLTVC